MKWLCAGAGLAVSEIPQGEIYFPGRCGDALDLQYLTQELAGDDAIGAKLQFGRAAHTEILASLDLVGKHVAVVKHAFRFVDEGQHVVGGSRCTYMEAWQGDMVVCAWARDQPGVESAELGTGGSADNLGRPMFLWLSSWR